MTGITKYYVNLSIASKISNNNYSTKFLKPGQKSEIHIDPDKVPNIMNMYKESRVCNSQVIELAAVLKLDTLPGTKKELTKNSENPAPETSSALPLTNKSSEQDLDNMHDKSLEQETQKELDLEKLPKYNYQALPRILITGFDDDETIKYLRLTQKIKHCKIAKSMSSCTHLVTNGIKRTVKFLSSLNVCSYILNKNWILDSFELNNSEIINFTEASNVELCEKILKRDLKQRQENLENSEPAQSQLDETNLAEKAKNLNLLDYYTLKDPINEEKYNVKLQDILKQRRYNQLKNYKQSFLLTNYIIATTPNIKPNLDLLSPIILSAGGSILSKLPTMDELIRYHDSLENLDMNNNTRAKSIEDSNVNFLQNEKFGIQLIDAPQNTVLNTNLKQKKIIILASLEDENYWG